MNLAASFQVSPDQIDHVFSQFVGRGGTSLGREQVMPYVIFQHFGHETVDAAPHISYLQLANIWMIVNVGGRPDTG